MFVLPLLFACFLVSGACGLMYETVWLKQVSHVFGSTVVASTVVLGSFMGGLALGSWAAGRIVDRIVNPLRLYAWLEVGIALSAFAFPPALALVRHIDRTVLVPRGITGPALLGFEIAAVSLLLLVPAALMGATLPVLCRFALPRLGASGRTLGLLYAVNSAGAVLGALVAGYWMIESYGLKGTTACAQLLNLAVGAAAFVADLCVPWTETGATSPTGGEAAAEGARLDAGVVHAHVFLCGFSAMLYEIALMKLLPLVVGSSTQSFSLMVSAFISGLAIGSAVLGSWIARTGARPAKLGALQLAVGGLFLVSIPLYNYLPHAYIALRGFVELPYAAFQLAIFGLCFAVMLAPTVFLGGVLPAAGELVARGESIGRDVARLYTANTIGNILGTAITGLVLVPRVGFKTTMEIGVAVNVLSGLVLLWRDAALRPRLRLAVTGAAALIAGVYALAYPAMDVRAISAGVFRTRNFGKELYFKVMEQLMLHREVLWSREDDVSFVTVERTPLGLTLRVNGKADASTSRDMVTQKLLGHLPMIVHGNAKKALVIGLGSGMTVASTLKHDPELVECAEISPAVVEGARLFGPWNDWVHHDKRVKIFVDDGRNHVERSRETYDVVVSEPSNPWMAGIGSLYTEEFFTTVRGKLAPGGLMAQWMHVYEMDVQTFRMVLRTITRVFPWVSLFRTRSDVIMLASATPRTLDLDVLAERIARPAIKADLAKVGMDSLMAFSGLHWIPAESVGEVAGLGPVNTDEEPRLEYLAPRAMFRGDSVVFQDTVYRRQSPHNLFGKFVRSRPLDPDVTTAYCAQAGEMSSIAERIGLLTDALAQRPSGGAHLALSRLFLSIGERTTALSHAQAAARMMPRDAAAFTQVLRSALSMESEAASFVQPLRMPVATEAAAKLVELRPGDWEAVGELADVTFAQKDWQSASALYARALELAKANPSEGAAKATYFLLMLALSRLELGDLKGAEQIGAQMVLLRDKNPTGEPALERELEYRVTVAAAKGQER